MTARKSVVDKKPAQKKVSAGSRAAAKATPKKAAANKVAAAKAPAKKAAVKKAPAKKAAVKKAPAKKSAPKSKKAAAKKPGKAVFSETFLAKQRKALEADRATYYRQFRSLRAEADSLVADFESGDVQFDEESGEGDTLAVERERDLALSAQAYAAMEDIDYALAKFDLGTYGICEVSGQPIPKARLEAIPWARERVEYKTGGLTSR